MRRAARANLGVDGFVVGTFGRLSKQKRHDVLIEAVALAASSRSDLTLVIVGGGELEAETRRLADRGMPGRVILTGHRRDATELLPAFDVFAMSSDFEGLPFALLEAMATSRPIVTTDVQGTGEAVRHEREGLLVPRRNARALADALIRLATDPVLADRLGAAARKRFVAEFFVDKMVERTEAIYQELLNGSQSR
jgi:glycosyltransferase involved in cell wall biosynthesis